MGRSWRDRLAFFRQAREHYHTTGAVAPSSRFLARAQAGPLARLKVRLDRPVRVLEVGPGTGAVTRRIVGLLEPGDTFDLVEINRAFADLLERRFRDEPVFARLSETARVHAVPLQEFHSETPYDVILSGLPMNNFSSELVEELFEAYLRLLAPEGTLSYFEYMYMRPMRKLVSGRDDRGRVNRIAEIMSGHCRRRQARTSWVFMNLPPAWVQHLSGTATT
jgi:phospholipid N-methyltransferase